MSNALVSVSNGLLELEIRSNEIKSIGFSCPNRVCPNRIQLITDACNTLVLILRRSFAGCPTIWKWQMRPKITQWSCCFNHVKDFFAFHTFFELSGAVWVVFDATLRKTLKKYWTFIFYIFCHAAHGLNLFPKHSINEEYIFVVIIISEDNFSRS